MLFAFDECFVGCEETNSCHDQQQRRHKIFPGRTETPKQKNYCIQTLQVDFVLALVSGLENPVAEYQSRFDFRTKDRMHLNLNDAILVFKIEIAFRSKTPIQNDVEDVYIPDETEALDVATLENPTIQTFLALFSECHHKDKDQYHKSIDNIRSQLQPFVTLSAPTLFFTQFYQRNQVHMVSQVCPSRISGIFRAQGLNSDVQRMIRIGTVQVPLLAN